MHLSACAIWTPAGFGMWGPLPYEGAPCSGKADLLSPTKHHAFGRGPIGNSLFLFSGTQGKFMCSRLQEAAIYCQEKYHGRKKGGGGGGEENRGKVMMAPRSYCQVRSRRVHFEAATQQTTTISGGSSSSFLPTTLATTPQPRALTSTSHVLMCLYLHGTLRLVAQQRTKRI